MVEMNVRRWGGMGTIKTIKNLARTLHEYFVLSSSVLGVLNEIHELQIERMGKILRDVFSKDLTRSVRL